MLNKQISSFKIYEASGSYDKCVGILDSLASFVNSSIFQTYSVNFSTSSISLVILSLMPYTNHTNQQIRTRCKSFINHWLSLAVSFCPKSFMQILLKNRDFFDGLNGNSDLLFWASQAVLLLPSPENQKYVDLCKEMIFQCSASTLKKIPEQFWNFISDNLCLDDLNSIMVILSSNKELVKIVYCLCKKDFDNMVKTIFNYDQMDFLAKFIGCLEVGVDKFSIIRICERVSNALQDNNSSVISSGIELLIQLVNFLWWEPSLQEKMYLTPLCYTMLRLVDTHSTLLIHKANCLEALVSAAIHGFFELDDVVKYVSFNENDPPPIRLSTLKISFLLLGNYNKEVIFKTMEHIAEEKDPVLFVSFLNLFSQHYKMLKEIDEVFTFKILNISLYPLSKYYIEQIQIIKLLTSAIDDLNDERVDFNINNIIRALIKESHPAVIEELKEFFCIYNYVIDINNLDWFGEKIQFSLMLLNDLDPYFLVEILDLCLVPQYSIASCLTKLIKHMDVLKSKCLSQIILIINDCLEIMNIDIKLNLLKEKFDESKRWIQRESLKELYQFTQVILKDSIFGKIFENSIFALISCLSFINIDEKGILSLIDLCFSIFNPFCKASCKLLLKIYITDAKNSTDKFLIKKQNKIESFFNYAYTDPVKIVKTAVKLLGPEKTLISCKDIIISALSVDRKLAKEFSILIEQPLPLMPTFLSFANIEKHSSWFKECKSTIPRDKWIFIKGEEGFYEEEKPIMHSSYTQKEYIFKQNEIKLLNFQIHSNSESSLYSLISFLWFSDLNLPNNISFEMLESFVIENILNHRLFLGFLSYCLRKGLKINEKFFSIYKINLKNNLSMLCGHLLFSSIKCKWHKISHDVIMFIHKLLEEMKITEFDEEAIYYFYNQKKGLKKLLLQSIMLIDEEHFPLVQVNTFRFEKIDKILDSIKTQQNVDFIHVFSNLCYYLFDDSSFIQKPRLLLPSLPNIPSCLLYFTELSVSQNNFSTKYTNTDKILSIFHEVELPLYFMSILFNLNVNESILSDFCFPGSPFFYYLKQNDKNTILYYDLKPPSYSRFASKMGKNDKFIISIHPALCYTNSKTKIWDNAPLLAKIRNGIITEDELNKAMELSNANSESIDIYNALFDLFYFQGNQQSILPSFDLTTAIFQNAKKLVNLSLNNFTNVCLVIDIFKSIVETLPIEKVSNLFTTNDFFKGNNLISICILFNLYKKYILKTNNTYRINMIESNIKSAKEIFNDQYKTRLFLNMHDEENIKNILDYFKR